MLLKSQELYVLKRLASINTSQDQTGEKSISNIRAERKHFAFKK